MTTDERPQTDSPGDIENLERKIAELRLARAQMHAERDEHARSAARAATVRDGLASLHSELTLLAAVRGSARDVAERDRKTTAEELAILAAEAARASEDMRALEERLTEGRARASTIEAARLAAESSTRAAADTESIARAQYDETSRSADELKAKLDAASSEAELAARRSTQFADIAATLDREQAAAEALLETTRARYEAAQLAADLERIGALEIALAAERADIERRIKNLAKTEPFESSEPPAQPHEPNREVRRVSLARRLERDFGGKP